MLTPDDLKRWQSDNMGLTWSPSTEGAGSGPARINALIAEVLRLRGELHKIVAAQHTHQARTIAYDALGEEAEHEHNR